MPPGRTEEVDPLKPQKLFYPSCFWRRLVREAFRRQHPEAPAIVANAVIILDNWLRPTDRGLEWGSGRSTIWLASRVAHVLSVEHNPVWYTRVQDAIAARGLVAKVA
jgi:hypothetical protein